MAVTRLVTIADLAEIEDDGNHYDLIEGELQRMPPASEGHGFYGGDLVSELGAFVRRNNLGRVALAETGFIVSRDPDTLLAPDGAFVRADRIPEAFSSGYSTLVPDLVIDVTSPTDRRAMIERKIQLWLAAGVQMLWQIDPERRTVTVYRPAQPLVVVPETGELDGGDIVPGFRLKLSEIFG